MNKTFEDAIKYVKKNHKWSDALEQVALERINHYRCGIMSAVAEIAEEIRDLMEEYGEDHDLPEGWWLEYGDEGEVFLNM